MMSLAYHEIQTDSNYNDRVSARVMRSLEAVDKMPSELRACVHEFGYAIVNAFVIAGISNPATIRRLVFECWNGARQPRQRGGLNKSHSPVLDQLDWILVQAKAEINAKALIRLLDQNSMVIVPKEPSPAMVRASMDAVHHMGVVSKSVKHTNRLRAAIRAGARSLWPHLFETKAK